MKTKAKWLWIFTSIGIALIGITILLWSEVELCDLKKTVKAEAGYKCQVKTQNENVIWQLHVKTASGKKVWKDIKSGLLVSDILEGKYTQYQAEQICTNPSSLEARGNLTNITWGLLTGYPKDLNGQYGFPGKDSDFAALEANGVRKVIDMSRRWFWSSSVSPKYSDFAYHFDGNYGGIGVDVRGVSYGSVLCVGR